jgi:hypothetical protein
MSTSPVICPSCSFSNPPNTQGRCASCGAQMTGTGDANVAPGDEEFKQTVFSPLWFGLSILIVGTLTGAIVFGLPMLVPIFDFEGMAGMLVAIPVWFACGLVVGLVSPGRTFAEPVAATLLVAVPTALQLVRTQTVKAMPTFMYVLLSLVGLLFALVGSYVGERIQVGPQTKPAPSR